MKDNTYKVYFVFPMQIIGGVTADLQAPCKNSDVLRWLICWHL